MRDGAISAQRVVVGLFGRTAGDFNVEQVGFRLEIGVGVGVVGFHRWRDRIHIRLNV